MVGLSGPNEEPLVCFCHCVTASAIREAVRNGARTHLEIQARTLASTGCGGCTDEVLKILAEELAKIQAGQSK